MIGKTIKDYSIHKEEGKEQFDDCPMLTIFFTDGTRKIFKASYGGFSGNSEDEYPSYIYEFKEEKA